MTIYNETTLTLFPFCHNDRFVSLMVIFTNSSIRELADSAIANNNAAAAAAATVRLAAPAPAPDEGNDDADNWDGLVPLFAGLGEDDETQDPEEPLAALDGGGGGNNEPDEAYDNNNFLAFDGSDEDGNDEAINRRNFAPTLIAPGSICRGIMVFGKYLMVLLIIFLLSAVLAFSSGMGLSFGWVYFELHNPFLTGPTARTGGTSTTDPLSPPYTTTPTPVASPVPVATTVATVEHHTGISDGPTLEGKNESNAIDFDLVAPPVDPTGDSTVATPPVVFSPSKTTPVASPVTVATVEPHTGIADGPTFQGKNESPAIDFDLLPPVNPIGDRTVANSPVAVVTDAIKSATNRTATHKDQTDIDDPILGTDMSPTIVGCMFLAPDTCIIDNFVCCECDDTEMGIKTGGGTDLVSDEDTKEEATTGDANESNDRGSTSSFRVLCIGGVLMVLVVICIVPTLYAEHTSVTGSVDSLTSTTLTMHRESNIRTEHLEEIKIPANRSSSTVDPSSSSSPTTNNAMTNTNTSTNVSENTNTYANKSFSAVAPSSSSSQTTIHTTTTNWNMNAYEITSSPVVAASSSSQTTNVDMAAMMTNTTNTNTNTNTFANRISSAVAALSPPADTATASSASTISTIAVSSSPQSELFRVEAPKGPLGITLEQQTNPTTKHVTINNIKEKVCAVKEQLRLGDELIGVDDMIWVSKIPVLLDVVKLIKDKQGNPVRTLTFRRPAPVVPVISRTITATAVDSSAPESRNDNNDNDSEDDNQGGSDPDNSAVYVNCF